ncbi:fatty acid desaturase family protein [Rhodopseudomonas sp. NSM]|uniref:fatty acid desaturase family protein n=1 Tax=Rhodopseudomonas sp. NSM TaxID=3457630 RepID=UPI004037179E
MPGRASSQSHAPLRLAAYVGAVAALLAAIVVVPGTAAGIAAALLLGIVYAHGLELQHETLHGIFLATEAGNRLAGSLLGLPMLTTFTDTRIRHLHHHRYVGTPQDVFDRSCADFSSRRALLGHVFAVTRLRDFAGTTATLLSGRRHDVLKAHARDRARTEFVATALILLALLVLAAWIEPRLVLWGWIVPALIVAPVAHFLMTVHEHIGRPRLTRRITENSRSYRAPAWWSYLVHYDNYHIEHHLEPGLPFPQLPAFHAERRRAGADSLTLSQAMAETARGIAACLRPAVSTATRTEPPRCAP